MPTSAEELALVEQEARYDAIKELLEIDLKEESPSQAKYNSVTSRFAKLEEHYLNLKVAFKKYRKRIVPSQASEENFNDDTQDGEYLYNDTWIKSITTNYVKATNDISTYLEEKDPTASQNTSEEAKVSVAAKADLEKLTTKIKLELEQVTQSVDDTYKKLEGVTSINTGQSQAYICLKNELITVLDEKLPSLLQSVHVLADASDQESVQKLEVAYTNLEAKEKPRLYQLSRLIAEKTAEAPPSSSSTRPLHPALFQ